MDDSPSILFKWKCNNILFSVFVQLVSTEGYVISHLVLKLPLLTSINQRHRLKATTELLNCSSILESIRYLTHQKYGYRTSEAQPNSVGIDFLFDRTVLRRTTQRQANFRSKIPFRVTSTSLDFLSLIKLHQYTSPSPCLHHRSGS